MARSYPVTIGNQYPLTQAPLEAVVLPPRRHAVPRVNRPTRTGLGALGSGGYLPSLAPDVPTAGPTSSTGDCEGCE